MRKIEFENTEALAEKWVTEWRELCRIPSVSGALEAIHEAANWIERRLAPLMDETRRIDIPGYGPVVAGRLQGDSDQAILLYTHYDTQPAGSEDRWSSPPFAADVHDGKVFARGACDDKADVASRLQALSLWLATHNGRPPFTIVFLADPAEEVGSPGLREVLEANRDFLRADACLWESYLREVDGRPAVGFGCRGTFEVALRVETLGSDQHTSLAPILRSPALELIRAIASLTDETGLLALPEIWQMVDRPTQKQLDYAAEIVLPMGAANPPGTNPYLPVSESELKRRWSFAPALSVGRIVINEDEIGVIPAAAEATIRISQVPSMTPEECMHVLRRHFDIHGFADVDLKPGRMILPAASPTDSPFATAVLNAARETWGEPVVYPLMTGAGPGRIFLDVLGAPLVSPTGTLRPDGNMHAVDEHGAINDYLDHVRFNICLLEQLTEVWADTCVQSDKSTLTATEVPR
jgi:acetylornithine deacetylase/succinyl-diaminopimelate desuccinylase-like protein